MLFSFFDPSLRKMLFRTQATTPFEIHFVFLICFISQLFSKVSCHPVNMFQGELKGVKPGFSVNIPFISQQPIQHGA